MREVLLGAMARPIVVDRCAGKRNIWSVRDGVRDRV